MRRPTAAHRDLLPHPRLLQRPRCPNLRITPKTDDKKPKTDPTWVKSVDIHRTHRRRRPARTRIAKVTIDGLENIDEDGVWGTPQAEPRPRQIFEHVPYLLSKEDSSTACASVAMPSPISSMPGRGRPHGAHHGDRLASIGRKSGSLAK